MLSADAFDRYHNAIETIAEQSAAEVVDMLRKAWRSSPAVSASARRETLKTMVEEAAPAVARRYGLASAEVAAALWEDIYTSDTGAHMEALVADLDDETYFGPAATTIVQGHAISEGLDGASRALSSFAHAMVMDFARQTIVQNTRRVARSRRRGHDKARWIRVPTGDKTCAWCMMLASRGPVYYTEDTAGGDEFHGTEMDRFHSYCDCEIVAAFSDAPELDGYSWQEYEAMYRDAIAYKPGKMKDEIVDLNETLSNMRRMYGLK